jgi:hypothetical protein
MRNVAAVTIVRHGKGITSRVAGTGAVTHAVSGAAGAAATGRVRQPTRHVETHPANHTPTHTERWLMSPHQHNDKAEECTHTGVRMGTHNRPPVSPAQARPHQAWHRVTHTRRTPTCAMHHGCRNPAVPHQLVCQGAVGQQPGRPGDPRTQRGAPFASTAAHTPGRQRPATIMYRHTSPARHAKARVWQPARWDACMHAILGSRGQPNPVATAR